MSFDDAVRKRAIELVRDGASYAAAAREVGCHAVSVKNWCREAGVSNACQLGPYGKRYSDAVRERAIDLVRGGMNYSAAAREMGVHPVTLRRWCRDAGLASPHPPPTPSAIRERAIEMVRLGATFHEAASEVGTHKTVVHGWCKNAGVRSRRSPGNRTPDPVRQRAIALVREGDSYSSAAKAIGASPAAVACWCHDAGVRSTNKPKKRTPDPVRQRAIALVREGDSYSSAAKAIGVNPDTVARWCRDAGVRSTNKPKKRVPDPVHQRAIALVRAGASYSSAAKDVGVSINTVSRWCKAAGVSSKARREGARIPAEIRNRAIALVREGASYAKAAKEVGVSAPSVSGWCKEAKVASPGRARPEESRDLAVALVRKGFSYGEAAKKVGVTAGTAFVWCKDAGVFSTRPGQRPAPKAARRRAISIVRKGGTLDEAAKEAGVSVYTAGKWCQEASVPANRTTERRRVPEAVRSILRRMVAEGFSIAEAARLTGLNYRTAYGICREPGARA
jgi:transposase-like protein